MRRLPPGDRGIRGRRSRHPHRQVRSDSVPAVVPPSFQAGMMRLFRRRTLMRIRTLLASVGLFAAAMATGADYSYDKLYSAIRSNDIGQMKSLLGEGATANAAGPDGLTPLMVAAEAGSLDAMKLLVDKGADVNAKNASGSTALMWSVTDA